MNETTKTRLLQEMPPNWLKIPPQSLPGLPFTSCLACQEQNCATNPCGAVKYSTQMNCNLDWTSAESLCGTAFFGEICRVALMKCSGCVHQNHTPGQKHRVPSFYHLTNPNCAKFSRGFPQDVQHPQMLPLGPHAWWTKFMAATTNKHNFKKKNKPYGPMAVSARVSQKAWFPSTHFAQRPCSEPKVPLGHTAQVTPERPSEQVPGEPPGDSAGNEPVQRLFWGV